MRQTRLGVVYPGGGAEQEYYQFADASAALTIYLVVSRRSDASGHSHRPAALRAMARIANLVEAARRLIPLQPDAVMWACTSGSFIVGKAGAQRQARAIQQTVGAPASSTSLAFVTALRRLGAQRVAIAATYPPAVAHAFATFLGQFGITISAVRSLGLRDGLLSSRLRPPQLTRFARAADVPEAEALLLPDTALPAFGTIERLEQLVGKPVLSANQVTLWEGLRLAGGYTATRGFGRLFTLRD